MESFTNPYIGEMDLGKRILFGSWNFFGVWGFHVVLK